MNVLHAVKLSAAHYVECDAAKHEATVGHALTVLDALTGGSRCLDDIGDRKVGASTRKISAAGDAGGLPMSPQYVTAWGRLGYLCEAYGADDLREALDWADVDTLLPRLSAVPALQFGDAVAEDDLSDVLRVVRMVRRDPASKSADDDESGDGNGDSGDGSGDDTLSSDQVLAAVTASILAAVKSGRVVADGPLLDAFNDAVCAYLDAIPTAPVLAAV
jgi:hypothetical protein